MKIGKFDAATGEYTEYDASDEDIAAQEAAKLRSFSEDVRRQRNSLLAETDLWVIRSAETGQALSAEKAGYRQALRDLPDQEGFPFDITWPEMPA